MIPRNIYNNAGGMAPFPSRKYSNVGLNRNIEPNRNFGRKNSTAGNNNLVRNSVMNKTKSIMNSVKYAPRASILDIYGELSNFFPVKEGDEVLKRARETGKHMSIMMEKVEQLHRRLSNGKVHVNEPTPLSKKVDYTIKEEPSESTNKIIKSSPSKSSLSNNEKTESDSKIDDILLNDLINSDNAGKKTTVASVYKLVIKSQEREKMNKAHVQKSVVVKKSPSKVEFDNKDKPNLPTIVTDKSSMVPSPLRDNSTLSPVSTSTPIKHELVIKTKVSPSIRIEKTSPSGSLPSPSTSQLRKISDIESGNMSDELKHRTSHIIHIKTPSDHINVESDSVMLVSPGAIMHTTLDFPIVKKKEENEMNKEENKTETNPEEEKNEQKNKTNEEPPTKVVEEDKKESEEFVEKPINWIKGKLIGQGSFGKVYYGMNTENNQIMAVKQVDIKNKKMVEALNAEIDFMKDLRHENIVHYYGKIIFCI